MRSGSLRHKIQFEQRTRVSDGGGGTVQGWEDFSTSLNARIKTLNGAEAVHGDKLAGVLTHEITIRNSSAIAGISSLMRIKELKTGRLHDVKAIVPDERGRQVVITTQTGKRVA